MSEHRQDEDKSEVSSNNETSAFTVQIYNDENTNNNADLLSQIKNYATEIQCSDFQGKGTVEDYAALFRAASNIANEVKQIELDVDIEGFRQFGQAADELSALFESFTLKLQNLTIIDDTVFLTAIADSLAKILNLSNVFGRFKKTISATATVKIPQSVQEATLAVTNVMEEVSCAMGYITYFVEPAGKDMPRAQLGESDKKDIEQAVELITHWNDICAKGLSTALDNNDDIVHFKQANEDIRVKSESLKKLTGALKAYISKFKL